MRLLVALLLLTLVPGTSPGAVPGGTDEARLKQQSVALMEAVQRKDRRRLDALLAPDFMLTAPHAAPGEGVPRATWLDNAVNRDWSDFRYENLAVQVLGDGAIVTSRLRFRVSPMPFALDSDIVDVWRREGGGWRLHRRYLGQSERQGQIAFAAGAGAALLAVALLLGLRRLRRRRRDVHL